LVAGGFAVFLAVFKDIDFAGFFALAAVIASLQLDCQMRSMAGKM